jgi:hypothetical protein
MKVLLVCKGQYQFWFPQVAELLRSTYDLQISAISFTTAMTERLEGTGTFEKVFSIPGFLKDSAPKLSVEDAIRVLQDADRSRNYAAVNTMVYADRIIGRYSPDEVWKLIAALFLFWRNVFSDYHPDLVVGEVASGAEWVGWDLANERRIPYLIPYNAPLPNRFYLLKTPAGGWDSAKSHYEASAEFGLSDVDRQSAETFINKFRRDRVRSPIHMFGFESPFAVNLPALLERIGRIPARVRVYKEDGHYDVGSYDGTPPWESVWSDCSRLLRYTLAERRMHHTIPGHSRLLYFALHMQPEFTTDVRAPFLTDQLALIHYIAKSLPPGHELMVKEHPAMKGYRELSYYRRLTQMHSVRLMSPGADSHELIKASAAVLTITGTTAWEGLLYQKPVIAFGPLCYGFADGIFHCDDLAQLRFIIDRALREYRPDQEALLRLVAAVLNTAHPGQWHSPLSTPGVLEPANLELIAEAIYRELSELAPPQTPPSMARSQTHVLAR